MQNYVVKLTSSVSNSYRCQKAANSLDIDVHKKSQHNFSVDADLVTPYNIGLIVGASGSGKTTLCHEIFDKQCFQQVLDLKHPVIEQFPKGWGYDDCAKALSGMGLTSVPCWIRPAYTLSNGQRARAEAALQLSRNRDITVIDEWTSVVDRTVAKVMSHCVAKYARKLDKQIVLAACHYDIIDWLNPDWIIDCNKQTYTDRRSMVGTYKRTDRLCFSVKEVSRKTWHLFSKYHYLSDRLPGGKILTYGLFDGKNQIGFQCFAQYIIGDFNTYFSNRTVIHPDYAGLGLGIRLIDETSRLVADKGYRVKAKFSSTPIYRSMIKSPYWVLTKVSNNIKRERVGKGKNVNALRTNTLRSKVVTYHFDYKA